MILLDKTIDLYEGVVIEGDDIGIKVKQKGFNFINEYYEFFYKNTCLCRCTKGIGFKEFTINYKVATEEEKERIKGYKEALLLVGYEEKESEKDFIDLEDYKEPTSFDYLRSLTLFTDYDEVIDSGKINDSYVYVVLKEKEYRLCFLYVLKVGNGLGTASIYKNKNMFMSLEELQVELAVITSHISGKIDFKFLDSVEYGKLYNDYAYEIYKINQDYYNGYLFLLYEEIAEDYKVTHENEKLESLIDVLVELAYYQKLITYVDLQDNDNKDLFDCIILGEEVVLGDTIIGKTKEKGNVLNKVYEVIELNEDNSYVLIIWGLNNDLNINHFSKYRLDSIDGVKEKLLEVKRELEKKQERQQFLCSFGMNSFSGMGMMGMMGSYLTGFMDYEEQSFGRRLLNKIKDLF